MNACDVVESVQPYLQQLFSVLNNLPNQFFFRGRGEGGGGERSASMITFIYALIY